MKTQDFIDAVRAFGWIPTRTTKHLLFTNTLFRPQRPVGLSLCDRKRIEPDMVENTSKAMGLRWKDMDPAPRPKPGHPYFNEYQRLGLVTT